MRLWQLFLLAVESMRRARLRVALTAIGISVATGALVSMISFALGLQAEAEAPIRELGLLAEIEVRPKKQRSSKSPPVIDAEALEAIRRLEGVEIAYPQFRSGDILARSESGTSEAMGVGVPRGSLLEPIFSRVLCAGKFFSTGSELEAIPGNLLVERLGFDSPEAAIGETIELSLARRGTNEAPTPVEARIVGVFAAPGSNWRLRPTAILLPTDFMQGLLSAADEGEGAAGETFNQVTVRAENPTDVYHIASEIEKRGFEAVPVADHVEGMRDFFLFLDVLLGAVGTVGLVIAGLGILNTLLMAVLERTAEIGLYKSMGATAGDVRTIFLTEAAWLGLLGGLGGILLARVVCWLLGHAVEYYARTQDAALPGDLFRFPPGLLFGAILFSVAISILSGVYPASRAARIDPIRALRGE